MKEVWVTRAQPGAMATAARLRGLGFEPVIAPLIETRLIPANVDLAGVGALAFTSTAGVAAFVGRSRARSLPVFAVGEATAVAAREAGFEQVTSANGDVSALADLLIARRPEGLVLHARAAKPAGDLAGALERVGIPVRSLAVYETVATPPPREVLDRADSLFAVLVHSPSVGRRLKDLLTGVKAPKLCACCLSVAVAATLESLTIGPIVTAALPNEDALLSLLADP